MAVGDQSNENLSRTSSSKKKAGSGLRLNKYRFSFNTVPKKNDKRVIQ